jgi:hypothetical protein
MRPQRLIASEFQCPQIQGERRILQSRYEKQSFNAKKAKKEAIGEGFSIETCS